MELKAKSLTKNTKELSKEAISLALSGEWEQDAVLNRVILDVCPNDVEAMNRLGKSLMESGQYGEARDVLLRVVEAAPYNNIAKKNLARLEQLEDAPAPAKQRRKVSGAPQLFIEESGKSGATILQKPGSPRLLGSIAPGDPLTLAVEGSGLCAYVRDDEYLGRVEPKLGRRVIRLIEAGNKYEAAVIGVKEQGPSSSSGRHTGTPACITCAPSLPGARRTTASTWVKTSSATLRTATWMTPRTRP